MVKKLKMIGIIMKYCKIVEKLVFMMLTLIGFYWSIVFPVFPISAGRSYPPAIPLKRQ
jgi:hypothetical protein